ncbi:ion transporter [Laribacter hongkongensis]|uniref:ion transporter n=1 Tax=Laribacter hongkongensis TaxID=168471 RepID=UPI001D0CB2C4|nr:ion transporter [Laribacter hongkongensis]MCG9060012.1 ion transporter [Laribacter hongkongensis]MCG9086309.1 ion transporter [Laribacter hongkongensis]
MSPFPARRPWQRQCYHIIFESDTRAGRLFDTCLIVAIIASLAVVMLDSVVSIHLRFALHFQILEWFFTLLFTVEYGLRLACSPRPWRYARSFYGIIDLVSILPTYAALLVPEVHFLLDVRVLRLLRIFRIFKLGHYLTASSQLTAALVACKNKIAVFLLGVTLLVIIQGTIMYVVEGPVHGFTSIPQSIYWAVVTITTVGFGDMTPKTPLGQAIASVLMVIGYGIIAVPTGIFAAEFARVPDARTHGSRICPDCHTEGHEPDARFCRRCGSVLEPDEPDEAGPANVAIMPPPATPTRR